MSRFFLLALALTISATAAILNEEEAGSGEPGPVVGNFKPRLLCGAIARRFVDILQEEIPDPPAAFTDNEGDAEDLIFPAEWRRLGRKLKRRCLDELTS